MQAGPVRPGAVSPAMTQRWMRAAAKLSTRA
ncbi:Uncharacterised protein [Mycobacteroides abscessus subsp. abscessus]|nr:Uncharacterised protein [Mycobacteroides abscessus subsp. abscessus]